jgi:hypothetical protein
MFTFYKNLSKIKKIGLLFFLFIFSIPLGAFIGSFIGLISASFIPICCHELSCHSCLEFNGLFGYQASGLIGFFLGIYLFPISYITFIIYLKLKNKL